MTKQFFSKILIILLISTSWTAQAQNNASIGDKPPSAGKQLIADQPLGDYVNNLMRQFFTVAKDSSLSAEKKTAKVRSMLMTNLDFNWMGKFVLGRYRRGLSAPEISGFIDVYQHYLTKAYSEAVQKYNGERVNVKTVQKLSENEFVVKTMIVKIDQQPLEVDYLVRQFANGGSVSYKVFDIVTEGVSLINSQQSEFGGIIGSSSLDKLKQDLIQKTNS